MTPDEAQFSAAAHSSEDYPTSILRVRKRSWVSSRRVSIRVADQRLLSIGVYIDGFREQSVGARGPERSFEVKGYLPVTEEVAARAREHLRMRWTGTHFWTKDGKPRRGSLTTVYTKTNRLD